ncbi:MAG: NUDIX domain-containing protein [Elusimicrobiota bacterium]
MTARETASGGVVRRRGKILLVRVENLAGEKVWTFPKGHPEAGEGPRKTALREVEEETGYACRILAPLMTARYQFSRSQGKVSKTVRWFLMEPEKKVGKPDPREILSVRWAAPEKAEGLLRYPSDLKLFAAYKKAEASR